MPVIRVISTTMGVSTPASIAEGTGYYTYKGDPNWIPGARRDDDEWAARGHGPGPSHRNSAEEKAKRFEVFCAAREEDPQPSVTEAGRRAGIAAKTAHRYEQERKDKQREESQ